MTKILCQDLIEKFYQSEVRRSIRINANQKFNKTEKTRTREQGTTAPKKEKK